MDIGTKRKEGFLTLMSGVSPLHSWNTRYFCLYFNCLVAYVDRSMRSIVTEYVFVAKSEVKRKTIKSSAGERESTLHNDFLFRIDDGVQTLCFCAYDTEDLWSWECAINAAIDEVRKSLNPTNRPYKFGDITRFMVKSASKITKSPSAAAAPQKPIDREKTQKIVNNFFNKSVVTASDGNRGSPLNNATLKPVATGSLVSPSTAASASKTPSLLGVPPIRPICLESACWPDADPSLANSGNGYFIADNVIRLQPTEVDRIFSPRNIKDIQYIVALARRDGKKVSVRGTKHSMGGQTMAKHGYLIDVAKMKEVKDLDVINKSVSVGPGAKWNDLIYELNHHGLSPRTMQSYSSFSIGGTISVNAHGITTDFAMFESVISMEVVTCDGRIVHCSRDADDEGKELFALVIGGYGLFGIIGEIKLKIVPNVNVQGEMMKLSVEEFMPVYQGALEDTDHEIDIKFGRIDIETFDSFQLFVFRKTSAPGSCVLSHLSSSGKEMSKVSQMMYKWLLPNAYSLRKILEDIKGGAIEMDAEPSERNTIMYESAAPMVHLYSPLFKIEATFVLHEYFIPPAHFHAWVVRAKSILTVKYDRITLLNITIRYVHKDDTTLLAYSRGEQGSFAFVLYFRLEDKSTETDTRLSTIHEKLVQMSLDLNGTFYLPYRHHYSHEQVLRGYPNFPEFCKMKARYDPTNLFESSWSQKYVTPYSHPLTAHEASLDLLDSTITMANLTDDLLTMRLSSTGKVNSMYVPRVVSEFRYDSYRILMSNASLSQKCFKIFLKTVLNLDNAQKIRSIVSKACWDKTVKDDMDVYATLVKELGSAGFSRMWKSLKQLQQQRDEFTREVASILSRLGLLGRVKDVCYVGDKGKLALSFNATLGTNPTTAYVVHDSDGATMNAILERGSIQAVGKHAYMDYQNPSKIDMPSACVDMVTLMGGLHHMPQGQVMSFLAEVNRILKPGGLFLVREHDSSAGLLPLLDVAHSLFNALTGSSLREEKNERRAFRPLLEWREIVEASGLVDVMLYEVQEDDPTVDEMMVFMKGQLSDFPSALNAIDCARNSAASSFALAGSSGAVSTQATPTSSTNSSLNLGQIHPANSLVTNVPKAPLDALVSSAPRALLELGRSILASIIKTLESSEGKISSLLSERSIGQQFLAAQLTKVSVKPVLVALKGVFEELKEAKVREDNSSDFIPREFFLLMNSLMLKAAAGDATAMELIAVSVISDLQSFFNKDQTSLKGKESDSRRLANLTIASPLRDQMLRVFTRLFEAMPELSDLSKLGSSGFSDRIRSMIETKVGNHLIDAEVLTNSVLPYVDKQAWLEISLSLEEIIHSPQQNPFRFKSLVEENTAWWRVTMGFLGSKLVKPNSYVLTAISFAGYGQMVDMWKVAQLTRDSRGTALLTDSQSEGLGESLSERSLKMLSSAADLVRDKPDDDASMESLVRVLQEVGLAKYDTVTGGEWTWYRLPEWLQVEMITSFGDYLSNEPWFRFPFKEVFSSYLSVLKKESRVVADKFGAKTAYTSTAFIINFVPAIVMGFIGAQLYGMSLPIVASLGSSYSPEVVAGLKLDLIVVVSANANGSIPDICWGEIDPKVYQPMSATEIVPGLYRVTVPAMQPFTLCLQRLSVVHSLRIIRISSSFSSNPGTYSDVQVRVSVASEDSILKIRAIDGVTVAFEFDIPTVGTTEKLLPVRNLALSIEVPKLLDALREFTKIANEGVKVVQIYCYWNI